MKNFILTFALTILVGFGANAQNAKGDWYVGTGDIANVAWTDWAVSPTLGYGVTDKLMIGLGVGSTIYCLSRLGVVVIRRHIYECMTTFIVT